MLDLEREERRVVSSKETLFVSSPVRVASLLGAGPAALSDTLVGGVEAGEACSEDEAARSGSASLMHD